MLATVVTTTLAYVANRYWTYRHHSRSALRREYTLFFGFNLAGMVIQSGAVAVGKYGFGLNEIDDRHRLFVITLFGIGLATVFRFWAYRTFVFLKPPPDDEHLVTGLDAVAGLTELSTDALPRRSPGRCRPRRQRPARRRDRRGAGRRQASQPPLI